MEITARIRPKIPSIDDNALETAPSSLRDTNAPATVEANKSTKTVTCANVSSVYNKTSGSTTKRFEFDHVFTAEDSTEALFDRVYKETVVGALDGYSLCLFGYGGTGSGKTHTLAGGDKVRPPADLLPL